MKTNSWPNVLPTSASCASRRGILEGFCPPAQGWTAGGKGAAGLPWERPARGPDNPERVVPGATVASGAQPFQGWVRSKRRSPGLDRPLAPGGPTRGWRAQSFQDCPERQSAITTPICHLAPRSTPNIPRSTLHTAPRSLRAFTLLELLTVIAIIGLLAALIGPSLGNFKTNVVAAATQQMLTDIGRARQLAISQHTTVFMVFVPPGFVTDPSYPPPGNTNYLQGLLLLDKQMTGYNFVSLRNIGDQPGRHTPHYWSSWKSLPDGTFIPLQKFASPSFGIYTNIVGTPGVGLYTTVYCFSNSTNLPFPTEQTLRAAATLRFTSLPYIAFNYLGQLVWWDGQTEGLRREGEMIPLAKGSVVCPRDPNTHTSIPPGVPSALEVPLGNSTTNSFNIIYIDRLTGRARVLRQEVR